MRAWSLLQINAWNPEELIQLLKSFPIPDLLLYQLSSIVSDPQKRHVNPKTIAS